MSGKNTSLKPETINTLATTAMRVREHILTLSTDGGCFTGASLSATDLLVYLYKQFLHIPAFDDLRRDYFFLSKGHDVPALYGTFLELGYLGSERLKNHLQTNDHLYWHPNRNIPGVEFHSGSLGHLLSVAMGVAWDCKNNHNKVIVMVGDGELNEGSIWEGLLVAAAHKLGNLLVIVDRNAFQANAETENLIPLEPLVDKFSAFQCEVSAIDGHDFNAMHSVLTTLDFKDSKPKVVIASTVRGKGIPSIEKRADRWFCNFSNEEIDSLKNELKNGTRTKLHSETLTVR